MKYLKRFAATVISLAITAGICACGIPTGNNSDSNSLSETQNSIIENTDNNARDENTGSPQAEDISTEEENSIDEFQNDYSETTDEFNYEDNYSFDEGNVDNSNKNSIESDTDASETAFSEDLTDTSYITEEQIDSVDITENNTEEIVISENTSEIDNEENGVDEEVNNDNSTETEENIVTDSATIVGDGSFAIETSDGAVSKNGNTYTITVAGTYILSGTLADGQIIVNAGDDDEVELDLDGVDISCSYNSPIYAANAGKVKIKAIEGTTNTVSDLRNYTAGENDTEGSAAIYALCDMNLVGSGVLNIIAKNYNNGVHTKDDLKIKNVTLTVTAPNNALKGNDSVTIESGIITAVSTGGDAIKTDNSDISSKGNQRGTVAVSGGTVRLTAADDGIDAAYDIVISGGDIEIVKAGGKGLCANNSVTIENGNLTVTYSSDDAIHANNDNVLENGAVPEGNVAVYGGTVNIVYTADDGIHADGTLLIQGGQINIERSHEGLEGHYITIEDGNVYVFADDDAINATSLSNWGSDGLITISGGHVVAEVSGRDVDGIDSNGSYVQTGGFVAVSNPNADNSGNMSAIDIDGSIDITGGIIIALGTVPQSSGMGVPGGMGGFGGHGGGMGGFGRGNGGFGGMGQISLPTGYIAYSDRISAGQHTLLFNGTAYEFTLKNAVSGGWIWAEGITDSNYSLK